ncbi:MAG: YhbY family RNA-binding protein [Methylococcaceae bacterium]|nr:YhbY family RNA-binding protein [Methylococcaceae bacterium]
MNPVLKKKLKAQAHALNPVVMIGQAGLTEEVLKEISSEIAQSTQAENIQSIGQIAVFYRKNLKKA